MQKTSVKKSGGSKRVNGEPLRPAQFRFLTELAKERRAVAIFLINGLKLEGRIVSFDDYAILLEGDLSDHVYKHAISTIQPLTNAAKAVAGARAAGRSDRTPVKTYMNRAEPEHAPAGMPERKVRQPTIVVRPKRRIIKSTPGEE
jgi:host factor-I protein